MRSSLFSNRCAIYPWTYTLLSLSLWFTPCQSKWLCDEVAEVDGHELETPKPDHHAAWNLWNKVSHLGKLPMSLYFIIVIIMDYTWYFIIIIIMAYPLLSIRGSGEARIVPSRLGRATCRPHHHASPPKRRHDQHHHHRLSATTRSLPRVDQLDPLVGGPLGIRFGVVSEPASRSGDRYFVESREPSSVARIPWPHHHPLYYRTGCLSVGVCLHSASTTLRQPALWWSVPVLVHTRSGHWPSRVIPQRRGKPCRQPRTRASHKYVDLKLLDQDDTPSLRWGSS